VRRGSFKYTKRLISLFISLNADLKIKDSNDKTPFELCNSIGQELMTMNKDEISIRSKINDNLKISKLLN
jgi:hypothetical protein